MANRDINGKFISGPKPGRNLAQFKVTLWGNIVDSVYRVPTQTIAQVRDNLINKDGYNPNIEVQRCD